MQFGKADLVAKNIICFMHGCVGRWWGGTSYLHVQCTDTYIKNKLVKTWEFLLYV